MKNFLRKLSVLLIMVFGFASLVGCVKPNNQKTDDPSSGEAPSVTYEYALNKTSLELAVGETEQLSVTSTPAKELSVTFESTDSNVASVTSSGMVTAVGAGSATIKATVDGVELACAVTVTANAIEYEYTLNFATVTLEVEATKRLMVFVDPEKEITPEFESSDSNVATVDATGLITAISEGTATITVSVDGEELTCTVTVNPKPIEYEYAISEDELELLKELEEEL